MPGTERLPATRDAAKAWYATLLREAAGKSEDHLLRQRRWLSKNDLFYLLTVTCKRPDIDREWLFDRCREFQAEPDGFLDLWAREHYKSTIITFGGTLLTILNDPEITVGIFSHTRPTAKAFLKQIKLELEANVDLRQQFPEILWENAQNAPKWSDDDGIVVKRKGNPKEATIEAWGLVDGQPISKHFRLKVYDDVVTKESVSTPEMIKKTTDAWELSDNLGVEGGTDRYAGTRYHLFDSYSVIASRGIKTRTYPCTRDASETFTAENCVLMAPETLAEKRRKQGPYTFGAQMLLNPTADKAQGFLEAWLRYWPAESDANLTKLMIVDPAGSKKRRNNDYTSIWVFGYGADEKFRVLDYVRDRLNLSERTKHVFALHRKWRPTVTGYEEYGLQADIEHIEEKQDDANYRFAITKLGGGLAKEERIKRLVPTFEDGKMLLPKRGIVRVDHNGHSVDVIKQFREEEYLAFPVLAHDDGLDAMSRIHDAEMAVLPPAPDAEPEDDEETTDVDWVSR